MFVQQLGLLLQPPSQAGEETGSHRGGCTPDLVPPYREDRHLVGPALALPDHLLESRRRHELLQRDAEDRLDLLGREDQLRLLRQETHERLYQEPARRDVHLLKLAYDLDGIGAEVYLLFGLPQGRRKERVVPRLRATAGKGYLPRMVFEISRPERVDDAPPFGLEHDRHEDRCPPAVLPRLRGPRTPLPRLQMQRGEALVHLAPPIERPRHVLSQARRKASILAYPTHEFDSTLGTYARQRPYKAMRLLDYDDLASQPARLTRPTPDRTHPFR